MCVECWKEHGSPTIVNEKTVLAAYLIGKLYGDTEAITGGNLHCELDDFNVGHFSNEFTQSRYDRSVGPVQLYLERQIYIVMRDMTDDERASALALHDGYFGIEWSSQLGKWVPEDASEPLMWNQATDGG